jgi:uncharacterized membrane protein
MLPMKTFFASLAVAGLLVFTGCNSSPTGGQPAGGTFKLKGPSNVTDTEVKHGSEKTVEITIDAKTDFKEDISFTAQVDPADKGVTATVEPATVKASDPKKTEAKIKASDKAAAGEYRINVTGKPAKGEATTVTIKVKVPEKK